MMKKILMMIALVMGLVVTANAQTALVDNGTVKDNWYVGGSVGTNVWNNTNSWALFNANPKDGSSWWQTQPLHVDAFVGKMFSPYVGSEVNFSGAFNVHSSATFIDAHNLTANLVFNVTNLFGYDGKRRAFELEALGGAGWLHYYDSEFTTPQNALTVRGALRANFNVTKKLAITVTPEYLWLPKNVGENVVTRHGVNLSVGVKYRIPSARGNFPMKTLRSQSEVDALNSRINELISTNESLAKTNADLAETIKKLIADGQKVVVKTQNVGSIHFERGSSDVSTDGIDKLVKVLKETSGTITLTGTASPEGTETFNKVLAEKRAASVKNALVANGIDAYRIKIVNDYEAQRSVVITVE